MHAWAHRCQYSCALQLASDCAWRVAAHEYRVDSCQMIGQLHSTTALWHVLSTRLDSKMLWMLQQ